MWEHREAIITTAVVPHPFPNLVPLVFFNGDSGAHIVRILAFPVARLDPLFAHPLNSFWVPKKIPITRISKFFGSEDFQLEQDMCGQQG